jgi:hypothetical protein
MTRQLDHSDIRTAAFGTSPVWGVRGARRFGVAGPLRSAAVTETGAVPVGRPGWMESLAAIFATIGATGFANPGEQIRAWTLLLVAINVSMAVALGLALFAILR